MYTKITIILVFLLSINISYATNRYALVIGNSDYPFGQLRNPSNDAQDVASEFEKYGFDVDLKTNATAFQLKQSLDSLQSKLQSSRGIGIIYFAGHGVQFQAENFLLPVDVSTTSATELKRTALSLNTVVNTLDQAQNKLNLVILDACRNNPFKSSSLTSVSRGLQAEAKKEQDGLAPVAISVSSGTVFWYATRPGDVALDGSGRNSPFTSSLLQVLNNHAVPARSIISQVAIRMRNLKINQQPWQEGIWLEDFHFDESSNHKNVPVQIAKYDSFQEDIYRDYIKNCKKSGKKCKHLASVEKIIEESDKKTTIANTKLENAAPSKIDGYDDWLGQWQCTWAHNDNSNKGTSIVKFYKFEKNILYGTSSLSTCPQASKFKLDTTESPLKYTLLPCCASWTWKTTMCNAMLRITIEKIPKLGEQQAMKSSYTTDFFNLPSSSLSIGGEQTCIKIY